MMPTCSEITNAVREYNGDQSFKHDLALRAALGTVQSLPPSLGRFLAEVCLIADWGYIPLNGFSFQDRVAMAGEIETSWPLFEPMRSWHVENWNAETLMLARAVDLVSSHTLLLPTPGAKNRQLSFLSKYLHGCVNDAFPIWDRNARTALHKDNGEPSWPTYREWMICVRDEAATHKACCLEHVQLPGENLVRTLDKALYIIGGKILKEEEEAKEEKKRRASQPPGNSAK